MTKIANEQKNEYKGFGLFTDIADEALRNRNRAVVLANMAEDNMNKEGRITPKGAGLVMGYFNAVPEAERQDVYQRFQVNLKQRGFELVQR